MLFIIGGDFNIAPQKLPAFQAFKNIGTVEAFELFFHRFGYQLPPTCRGSTRHDTCLIHPILARHIVDMDVNSKFAINDHTPLRIHFDFEVGIKQNFHWEIPRSWHQLEPSEVILEHAYNQMAKKYDIPNIVQDSSLSVDHILEKWSYTVEEAVNQTLQVQHTMDPTRYPLKGLPKSCFGRCKDQQLKPINQKKSIPADKLGGYDPPQEVFRQKSEHKVRQVRRIKSLIRAIENANRQSMNGPWNLTTTSQLQDEWNAILRARGYPKKLGILDFELRVYHMGSIEYPTH